MLDGHFSRVSTVERTNKLESYDIRPLYSAPYQFWALTGKSAASKENQTLQEGVIKTVATKQAVPIIFSPNKNGTLRFYAVNQVFNSIAVINSYVLLIIVLCVDSDGETIIFSSLDAGSRY